MSNCTYCNSVLAEVKDHVIPRAYTGNDSFAARYVVPCCKRCNNLLGSVPCHTVEERAAYLYERYSQKYKNTLNAPDWTKQEIKDLKGTFKKQIQSLEKDKKSIRIKLENLRKLAGHWLVEV